MRVFGRKLRQHWFVDLFLYMVLLVFAFPILLILLAWRGTEAAQNFWDEFHASVSPQWE